MCLFGFGLALKSIGSQLNIQSVIAPWMLLPVLPLFGIHYFLQSVGWHFILRSLGLTPTFAQTQRMWFSSLMARWIPGPFVYSVARLVIARESGLPVAVVAYGVLLEMGFVVIGSVITTLVFLGSINANQSAQFISQMGIVGAIVVVGAVLVCFRPNVIRSILRNAFVTRVTRKLTGRDLEVAELPSLSIANSLGLVAFYALFWSYSGSILWCLASAIYPMHFGQLALCTSAFAGSWFVGFLAVITPAGLGVREVALYLLMGTALPKAKVILLAILMRAAMLVSELAVVAIAHFLLRSHGEKSLGRENKAPATSNEVAGD